MAPKVWLLAHQYIVAQMIRHQTLLIYLIGFRSIKREQILLKSGKILICNFRIFKKFSFFVKHYHSPPLAILSCNYHTETLVTIIHISTRTFTPLNLVMPANILYKKLKKIYILFLLDKLNQTFCHPRIFKPSSNYNWGYLHLFSTNTLGKGNELCSITSYLNKNVLSMACYNR